MRQVFSAVMLGNFSKCVLDLNINVRSELKNVERRTLCAIVSGDRMFLGDIITEQQEPFKDH